MIFDLTTKRGKELHLLCPAVVQLMSRTSDFSTLTKGSVLYLQSMTAYNLIPVAFTKMVFNRNTLARPLSVKDHFINRHPSAEALDRIFRTPGNSNLFSSHILKSMYGNQAEVSKSEDLKYNNILDLYPVNDISGQNPQDPALWSVSFLTPLSLVESIFYIQLTKNSQPDPFYILNMKRSSVCKMTTTSKNLVDSIKKLEELLRAENVDDLSSIIDHPLSTSVCLGVECNSIHIKDKDDDEKGCIHTIEIDNNVIRDNLFEFCFLKDPYPEIIFSSLN